MFNIHSTELILVAIVALIVIGPEKLPAAIRTASLWIGRFRRSFYRVKADIERELNTDEIRRQLHNEKVMAEIEEARSEVENTAKDTQDSVKKIVSSENLDPGLPKDSFLEDAGEQIDTVKKELDEAGEEIKQAARPVYGGGRNPKLAQSNDDSGEKGES